MALAAAHGGSVNVIHDPRSAVARRRRRLHRRLGVDGRGRRARAPPARSPGLPGRRRADARGRPRAPCSCTACPRIAALEVTAEVIDGPSSIVWEQAANRLPTEQATLHALIDGAGWSSSRWAATRCCAAASPRTPTTQRANIVRAVARRRRRGPRSRGRGHARQRTAGRSARAPGARPTATSTPYPLDVLGAESEGMIGYLLEQELDERAPGAAGRDAAHAGDRRRGGSGVRGAVEADRSRVRRAGRHAAGGRARLGAWRRTATAWRRVVASPEPRRSSSWPAIRQLVRGGVLVVCAGGGGIPVTIDATAAIRGVEAVVDKDRAAALLAEDLGRGCAAAADRRPARRRGTGAPPTPSSSTDATPARAARRALRRRLDGSEGRGRVPVRRADGRPGGDRRARRRGGDPRRTRRDPDRTKPIYDHEVTPWHAST